MNANPMINPNIQALMQLMQRGPNAAQQPPNIQALMQLIQRGPNSAHPPLPPQSAPAMQPPPAVPETQQPPPAATQAFTPPSLPDIIPEDAPATGPQMGPPTPEPQTGPQTPGAPSSYRSLVSHMGQGAQDAYDEAQSQMAELQEFLSQRRDTAGQFREGREAIDAQRPERFTTMSEDQRKALNDEFYDSLIAASSRPGSSFGMALGESLQARGARRRENVDRNEARWERDRDRQMREMVQGLQLEAGDDDATMQRKIQQMQMLQGIVSGQVAAASEGERLDQATQTRRDAEEAERVRVAEREETLRIAQRQHDENRADRKEQGLSFNVIQTMHNGQPVQAFYRIDRSAPEGQRVVLLKDENGELLYLPSQGSLRAAETAAERRRTIEAHSEALVRLANTGYFGENNRLSKEEAERLTTLSVDRWGVLAGMFQQVDEAIGGPQRISAMQAIIDFAKGKGSPTTGAPTTTTEGTPTTTEEPRPPPQPSTGLSTREYPSGYLQGQQERLGGGGR